jgi:hypothetical protein
MPARLFLYQEWFADGMLPEPTPGQVDPVVAANALDLSAAPQLLLPSL